MIGRTNVETEAQILWPPDVKDWLTGKDPEAGKDWRQEKKGTTEDGVVEWHHRLNGHEFEQGLGVGDGQGSLACCSPWGHKELDTTERLSWMYFILTAVLWSRYYIIPFHTWENWNTERLVTHGRTHSSYMIDVEMTPRKYDCRTQIRKWVRAYYKLVSKA